MEDLELWGGPECTLNRVGDAYRDQFTALGHYDRPADLESFAELGLSAIRYPVLWERVAPASPETCDWTWPDQQLPRLQAQGMRVIAGLVHHGSGPRYTDLLDPGFATGLAAFAGKVAARFPWIRDWTPVNEPLTTARFTALYGHWYPHHTSEGSFWLALVNQIDGVRLAMHAVRRVNAGARLVQTDDLGRTYATVAMREQAAFDNARRWMSWDLLCGRVVPGHPLWARLTSFGLEDRLRAIANDPCPPDIIGVNHYLTSDRFLDHRLRRYPARTHGGNLRVRYADVEAVRALEPPPPGLAGILRETWDRYGIPVAITEVHNGCTRDEQMRWIAAAWDTAVALRAEGIPIQAVTAWSLLGSAGWNTLLREEGLYEVGAFDVSGGKPRPTAAVPLLKGLTRSAERHPVLRGAGWWQRPIRLLHSPSSRPAAMREHVQAVDHGFSPSAPPLMICGAAGTLGRALARACTHRDIAHVLIDGRERESGIAAAIERHAPWAVIDAGGEMEVDGAAEEACAQTGAIGVAVARACADHGIPSVHFSSDLVFGTITDRPRVESDPVTPVNPYGRGKAAMERGVAELPGAHLIVRAAALFSPDGGRDPATAVVHALRAGRTYAAGDRIATFTYVPELADRVLDLTIDGEAGIWHLANDGTACHADFARRVAVACGLDPRLVVEVPAGEMEQAAPCPHRAPLASARGQGLEPLNTAIRHFADRFTGAVAEPPRASPALTAGTRR
jgi:dTDP-4-dehydrorhamnose reductase